MAVTDDDLKRLAIALAPFIIDAWKAGHSMVTMELDPVKMFGMHYKGNDSRMVVAFALGPSAPSLRQAIQIVQSPQ